MGLADERGHEGLMSASRGVAMSSWLMRRPHSHCLDDQVAKWQGGTSSSDPEFAAAVDELHAR